jgi:bifunctional DNA-binding transcriptional regulator/antitoxin component of YhaV-PrlF toxin-antitoxin module
MTRKHLPLFPTFRGGGLLVDVSDREALYDRMDGQSPLSPPEHFSLEVEGAGRVHLPPVVQESLDLQPGDLLSIRRNAISVRLDPFRDLLEDLQRSVHGADRERYLGQFLQRALTSIEADGGVEIPPDLLELAPGDRVVVEVSTEGLRHALYIYRTDA